MTTNEEFGYTDTGHAAHKDYRGFWFSYHGMEVDPSRVTPVQVVGPDEVVVKRVYLQLLESFNGWRGPKPDALRAALDAAPAEPTAEDDPLTQTFRKIGADGMAEHIQAAADAAKSAEEYCGQADCPVHHPSPREASTPDDEATADLLTEIFTGGTEPAHPSLPDTPWTTVRVILDDGSRRYWCTYDVPHKWTETDDADDADVLTKSDLTRVTSYEILAEPPKGPRNWEQRTKPFLYEDVLGNRHTADGTLISDDLAEPDDAEPEISTEQANAIALMIDQAEDRADRLSRLQRSNAEYTARKYTDEAVDQLRGEIVGALREEAEAWRGLDGNHYPKTTSTSQWVALSNVAHALAQSGQQHTDKENDA